MAVLSYRFIVTGRVQGVGFRQATQRTAYRLDLRGWVRNRPDGRVEGAVAAGDDEKLAEFRLFLDRGPPLASVQSVQWTASADEIDEQGFQIMR